MMDWSDRHYRYFMRQIAVPARVYTEMITTGALIHGDIERHLAFSPEEHPIALQLGGSEPEDLVQGIGIDRVEHYSFVRDFVGAVADAGCRTFIVHARNAVLKGLSPKENREIPPLKYHYVHQLKRDFPQLEIVINGGITQREQIDAQLTKVDGVMLGRAAYHDPWLLADPGKTRAAVVERMVEYARRQLDVPLRAIARHMLGLYHGLPRARLWRRLLSDAGRLKQNRPELLLDALEAVESTEQMA